MENLSRVFKKKQHIKRLNFITQFKIEFLPPFAACRKVPGKMADLLFLEKNIKLYDIPTKTN